MWLCQRDPANQQRWTQPDLLPLLSTQPHRGPVDLHPLPQVCLPPPAAAAALPFPRKRCQGHRAHSPDAPNGGQRHQSDQQCSPAGQSLLQSAAAVTDRPMRSRVKVQRKEVTHKNCSLQQLQSTIQPKRAQDKLMRTSECTGAICDTPTFPEQNLFWFWTQWQGMYYENASPQEGSRGPGFILLLLVLMGQQSHKLTNLCTHEMHF